MKERYLLDPEFEPLLRSHDSGRLDTLSEVVFGLWPDLRIAYLNPAWFVFARENGGEPVISTKWTIGSSIQDAMSPEILGFYLENYRDCLNALKVWNHRYECSSDSLYRKYHQIVYPLGQREGLLIVNSLVVERPHDPKERPGHQPEDSIYRGNDGLVHQCAHCRRIRRRKGKEGWDWVPIWVKRVPVKTSHTICPTCFGHYYPRPRE